MPCHGEPISTHHSGVAGYCTFVSLWLGMKQGHVAVISSVTGFFHFTVGMMLELVLLRLPRGYQRTSMKFAATIAKMLSAVGCYQLLGPCFEGIHRVGA